MQSNEFNSSAYAKGTDGEFTRRLRNGLTVFRPLRDHRQPIPSPDRAHFLDQEDQSIATATSETQHHAHVSANV
ncbi:MAG: hypothetical protein U0V48_00105 [Anaerolineales bacterium]